MRFSRAPGRLDVMGGIADYTGSLVCEATLDRAAAVAMQERPDRQLHVSSLNLLDEHQAGSWQISLTALAGHSAESLGSELAKAESKWAGYLAGCLFILHEQKHIDLNDPRIMGMSLALYSTVPLGAGVSSSAAIEVATMMALADHFGLRGLAFDELRMASLCQQVENRIVGAPCGIMDQVTSICGQMHCLLRLMCQPHELLPELHLPAGIRVLGINSHVKHSVGGGMYGKTRCAAFMGHKIILEKMRQDAAAARLALRDDPLKGYLANLEEDDYRKHYRGLLPEKMTGSEFLETYGVTIDTATTVDPQTDYHVQRATDHHVLESRRVKQFVGFLEQASGLPLESPQRLGALGKAGQIMYGSHVSYTNCALLGADECDVLVQLVRDRQGEGLYGAKITGGGSGGTVAVLADESARVEAAVGEIMSEYEKRTGRKPEAFLESSPGAWGVGTRVVGD